MSFDARAAKLLAAGQHFTIDECPGLRLKASATTRAWIYRYKSPVDGKMRQAKIGDWPAMSISAAIAAWEKLRDDRGKGVDVAVNKRQAATEARADAKRRRTAEKEVKLTVLALCLEYHAKRVALNRKPKGSNEVLRIFNTMLGDFGLQVVETTTRSQAFDLLESYLHIPVQCGKLRAELGAAWDYGLDSGKIPETVPNWWRLIMRGKIRSKGRTIKGVASGTAKRILPASQIGELIRWLPNFSRPVEDALTMYLWTCARGTEILTMERKEITEEADGLWWTLPKAKTKNARHEEATDFRVPLIGRAAEVVRRRLQSEAGTFIFPGRGALGHIDQKVLGVAVWARRIDCESRPELKRSRFPEGMPLWSPHDLRRSSRTLLAAIGCPDAVGEAILGHMKEGVKGVYNLHDYDQEKRVWLAQLNDKLERLATQKERV